MHYSPVSYNSFFNSVYILSWYQSSDWVSLIFCRLCGQFVFVAEEAFVAEQVDCGNTWLTVSDDSLIYEKKRVGALS